MLARVLVSTSSAIMMLLGSVHLVCTFSGSRLSPRDQTVQAAMKAAEMMLTTETTLWRAWIGFNASHSICAMSFGLVFGFLAIAHPEFLFRSTYFQALGLAVLVAFLVLAKVYLVQHSLCGDCPGVGLFHRGHRDCPLPIRSSGLTMRSYRSLPLEKGGGHILLDQAPCHRIEASEDP